MIELLDRGRLRVAELGPDGEVRVHEWLKRAIVMLFRVCPLEHTEAGPMLFADRLPPKRGCSGVRVVPGAYARFGSYLAPGAILMPSFVNVGAHVGTARCRHLGHGGIVRPGRRARAPLRRRGGGRGARAAAGESR